MKRYVKYGILAFGLVSVYAGLFGDEDNQQSTAAIAGQFNQGGGQTWQMNQGGQATQYAQVGQFNPIGQESNAWIQGVWDCESSTSSSFAQCQGRAQTKYIGNQYESEVNAQCSTGSLQFSVWGTYSIQGRGNLWSITTRPQGSVPPLPKALKPSTNTFRISEDRRTTIVESNVKLPDGSQMSSRDICHKVQ